jgi:hypothetical protein
MVPTPAELLPRPRHAASETPDRLNFHSFRCNEKLPRRGLTGAAAIECGDLPEESESGHPIASTLQHFGQVPIRAGEGRETPAHKVRGISYQSVLKVQFVSLETCQAAPTGERLACRTDEAKREKSRLGSVSTTLQGQICQVELAETVFSTSFCSGVRAWAE